MSASLRSIERARSSDGRQNDPSSRTSDRIRAGFKSGRAYVRTRWTPIARPGVVAASVAACAVPGAFVIKVVLVTMPSRCARTMPRLTPVDRPKSSAFTMRRFTAARGTRARRARPSPRLRGDDGPLPHRARSHRERSGSPARGNADEHVARSHGRTSVARAGVGVVLGAFDGTSQGLIAAGDDPVD